MCSSRLLAVIAALGLSAALHSQSPSFDVASIRPNMEKTAGEIRPQPNGRFTATGATPRALILRAYALHDSQLIGAPDWSAVERVDIDARVTPTPAGGPEGLLPLLRTLLAERFRLRAHTDTRELPAFLLVHARTDRTLGPQIRPTQADCSAGITTPPLDRTTIMESWPPCGMVYTISYVDGAGGLKMRQRRSGVTLKDFAPTLQSAVGRPVLDRTGLDGRYDIELSYAPQPNTNTTVAALQDVPLLGAALEEQLGLKLESQRTSVPVLVVDALERPTEN